MELDHKKIVGAKTEVTLLDGRKQTYINFDNAASTPAFLEVANDVSNFLPWYSSVHRGSGEKSRFSTRTYEESHDIVRQFVGANSKDHVVIFGKNTTDAINKVARRLGLNKDDVVIISTLEHHSNDLPWRAAATVKRIKIGANNGIDLDHLHELLKSYGQRVKLIAITGASNVTGCMPKIHAVAKMAHIAGAQILVDAAQLAPHRVINMRTLNDPEHLDYVAFSAHKMYAPFGTGALVGRRDTFEKGEPDYSGGGTINFVTKNSIDWADPPERDEAGSPNVIGAVALTSAIKQLQDIGMENVANHEAELTSYFLQNLQKILQITIYGCADPAQVQNRTGVVTFNIDKIPHALVAAILGYEHGIAVRSGCFCAHPYVLELLQISAKRIAKIKEEIANHNKTAMPGMVRVSFGLYNTKKEVSVLLDALNKIAAGDYANYIQDMPSGEYTPR